MFSLLQFARSQQFSPPPALSLSIHKSLHSTSRVSTTFPNLDLKLAPQSHPSSGPSQVQLPDPKCHPQSPPHPSPPRPPKKNYPPIPYIGDGTPTELLQVYTGTFRAPSNKIITIAFERRNLFITYDVDTFGPSRANAPTSTISTLFLTWNGVLQVPVGGVANRWLQGVGEDGWV